MEAQQRQIGQTDLFVSPIGFGAWPIAGMTSLDVNEKESIKTIAAAIDAGINLMDTAFGYGVDGLSERLIGQVVKPRRDDVVIASKAGMHWLDGNTRRFDCSPQRIQIECEQSLRRLQADTIDLYYLHAHDGQTPIADTADALLQLQRAGKIRAVGVSNLTIPQMDQFQAVCPIAAVQPPFNMLQRQIQTDLIPWCARHRASVISYWPLMKGLLAGKIRRGHQFDPADKRLTYAIFQGQAFEQAQRLIDQLDDIANDINKTVAQVVVNWTYRQPHISSVLCGAKRDWQIVETAGALGWELPAHHQQAIAATLQQLD